MTAGPRPHPAADQMAQDRVVQDRVVAAILPHVAFDGWTSAALRRGLNDAGMGGADSDALFPGGAAAVIAAYSAWADRKMVAAAEEEGFAGLTLRSRIARLVQARLQALAPEREAARRTAAYLALPHNAPLLARLLARTVDAAWRAAGDTSTDFSYYTRRGLLGMVYTATFAYWLEDRSAGAVATWSFLDRRIADVLRIGRLGDAASRLGERLVRPFAAAKRGVRPVARRAPPPGRAARTEGAFRRGDGSDPAGPRDGNNSGRLS